MEIKVSLLGQAINHVFVIIVELCAKIYFNNHMHFLKLCSLLNQPVSLHYLFYVYIKITVNY